MNELLQHTLSKKNIAPTSRIATVTSDQELDMVGRLRYSITVREMKLKMRYADHIRQVVVEPMDHDGHILAAWAGTRLVGTVRTNLLRRSNIGYYYEAYALDRFSTQLITTMSITTRLAIEPEYRGGSLFSNLAIAMYQYLLEEGITHDVIDCRKRLVPTFLRLGYLIHKPDLEHPEFGDVTVLSLNLRDESQLEKAHSPFLGVLRAWRRESASQCV